jgi:hypothetical protein
MEDEWDMWQSDWDHVEYQGNVHYSKSRNLPRVPIVKMEQYGVAYQTDRATLFFSNQLQTHGFWIPKSIIEKIVPRVKERIGQVYFAAFHNVVIERIREQHIIDRRSAEDDFSEFALPTPNVKLKKDINMKRVETNHLICMFQEGYTTIEVTFDGTNAEPQPAVAAPPPGMPRQQTTKLYTYKVLDNLDTKPGDHVIVPVGEPDDFTGAQDFKMARVVKVHELPEIDYDSNIIYRWVAQKVDLSTYNDLLSKEKKFKEVMVQAEKIKKREQLKAAFLETQNGSDAQSLLGQALDSLKQL